MTRPEPISHDEAALLLPWLVNGTLEDGEERRLRAHSDTCLACRRELGRLESLREAVLEADATAPVPAPDLRGINQRIDRWEAHRRKPLARLMRFVHWIEKNPWRAVAAVQALLLVALVPAWLEDRNESAGFETLTSEAGAPTGDYVRVVFAPELQAPEIRKLLESLDVVAVTGPSPRNVYTIVCAVDDCQATAARLRARADVLFAEPAPERAP